MTIRVSAINQSRAHRALKKQAGKNPAKLKFNTYKTCVKELYDWLQRYFLAFCGKINKTAPRKQTNNGWTKFWTHS